MSKEDVLAVLKRAADDSTFIFQLTNDFSDAVADYDLSREERVALASGDIRWMGAHIGKLNERLRTWPKCRLQQEDWREGDVIKERLKNILTDFEGKREEVIPILQMVQDVFGYLPKRVMLEIAKFTDVPESRVFGLATFYAQFHFTPRGKKPVMVCRGTACHVRGATRILEEVEKKLGILEGGTTDDQEYSLETVACIGCCALAPCIMINDEVHGRLTGKKVAGIFDNGESEGDKDDSE